MIPNLKELFGQQYKIGYDECCESRADPWMMRILTTVKGCFYYCHGDGLIGLVIDHCPKRFKSIIAIPGVNVHQDGEHEKTVVFPVEIFKVVAQVVPPRKKRHLSDEQKARMSQYFFKK